MSEGDKNFCLSRNCWSLYGVSLTFANPIPRFNCRHWQVEPSVCDQVHLRGEVVVVVVGVRVAIAVRHERRAAGKKIGKLILQEPDAAGSATVKLVCTSDYC